MTKSLFWMVFLTTVSITHKGLGEPYFPSHKGIKKFHRHHIDTRFDFNYYSTTENFNLAGDSSYFLPDESSFENFYGTYFFRWVYRPRWGVWTKVSAAQSTSEKNRDTEDQDSSHIQRVNRNLRDFEIGGDVLLLRSPLRLVGEYSLLYPFHSIDLSTRGEDDALLSEGALTLNGKFLAQHRFGKKFWLDAHLGFKYQSDNRASLVNWGTGARTQFGFLSLGFHFYGFFPLIKDSSSGDRRKNLTDRVNGASLRFFSKDPSAVSYSLNTSLQLSHTLNLHGVFYQELAGSNYSKGSGIMFSLEYSRPTPKRHRLKRKKMMRKKKLLRKKRKKQLEEQTDDETGYGETDGDTDEDNLVVEDYEENLFEGDDNYSSGDESEGDATEEEEGDDDESENE